MQLGQGLKTPSSPDEPEVLGRKDLGERIASPTNPRLTSTPLAICIVIYFPLQQ